MPSFSVRCVILLKPLQGQVLRRTYEERITIWQAADFEIAITLAEAEATAYAADGDTMLAMAQAYELDVEVPLHGIEVFSLIRESDLEPQYCPANDLRIRRNLFQYSRL